MIVLFSFGMHAFVCVCKREYVRVCVCSFVSFMHSKQVLSNWATYLALGSLNNIILFKVHLCFFWLRLDFLKVFIFISTF